MPKKKLPKTAFTRARCRAVLKLKRLNVVENYGSLSEKDRDWVDDVQNGVIEYDALIDMVAEVLGA